MLRWRVQKAWLLCRILNLVMKGNKTKRNLRINSMKIMKMVLLMIKN